MAVVHSLHAGDYIQIGGAAAAAIAAFATIKISMKASKLAENANEISRASVKLGKDNRAFEMARIVSDSLQGISLEGDEIQELYLKLANFDILLRRVSDDEGVIFEAKMALIITLPWGVRDEIKTGRRLDSCHEVNGGLLAIFGSRDAVESAEAKRAFFRKVRKHVLTAYREVAELFNIKME